MNISQLIPQVIYFLTKKSRNHEKIIVISAFSFTIFHNKHVVTDHSASKQLHSELYQHNPLPP